MGWWPAGPEGAEREKVAPAPHKKGEARAGEESATQPHPSRNGSGSLAGSWASHRLCSGLWPGSELSSGHSRRGRSGRPLGCCGLLRGGSGPGSGPATCYFLHDLSRRERRSRAAPSPGRRPALRLPLGFPAIHLPAGLPPPSAAPCSGGTWPQSPRPPSGPAPGQGPLSQLQRGALGLCARQLGGDPSTLPPHFGKQSEDPAARLGRKPPDL